MTILELDALTLEYDKQPVLSHIDLAVEKGELVSLLGHSGCGKTTLIKAIAGLHPLSGGRVLLQGQDASRLPPSLVSEGVLFIFQLPAITVLRYFLFMIPFLLLLIGMLIETRFPDYLSSRQAMPGTQRFARAA